MNRLLRPLRSRVPAFAGAIALLAAAACHGPRALDSSVEFQTERGIVRGVATEDGIFALADVLPPTGELSFRFRAGTGFFDDVAKLDRRSDELAVLLPKSTRLNQARFAAYPAARDEKLYVEVRTANHSDLVTCHLLDEGQRGDLLVLDERRLEFDDLVQRYAGAGVFAWRSDTLQLVGILNGVYSVDPPALAFIGLDEMATLLPASSNYFARKATPRRADFEYGVPRSFEGEKPAISDPPRADETAPTAPDSAPAPRGKGATTPPPSPRN